MSSIKYTKDHEVVKIEPEGDVITIGITEYAKDALGDLVFIELPEKGKKLSKGQEFAVVESVKIASEIYTPIAGEIVDVNEALRNDVDILKQDISKGWVVKIKITDLKDLYELMDEEDYNKYISGLH